MKISESSVNLRSESFKAKKYSVKEEFRFWVNSNSTDKTNTTINNQIKPIKSKISKNDKLDLDKTLLSNSEFGWKFELLIDMFESFFDKEIDLSFLKDFISFREDFNNKNEENNFKRNEIINKNAQNNLEQGWGFEYNREHIKYEKQMLNFSASGKIKTSDGKSISFNFNLDISSEILEKNNISIRAGDAKRKDPLIINFGGNSNLLSGKKFLFDIDSDGIDDKISYLKNGSGFLAFDKNNDKKINNGNELFGTKSGNGISDLRKYDDDNNGWIDENDNIFSKLSLWEKNPKKDRLSSLINKNIGAIYLNSSNGDFEIKSSLENKFGEIRKTGIFLEESGKPGSIHQLDLFV